MQPRPRTPSESSTAVRVMPGASAGTRNAVTPCPRRPGCVDANTMIDAGGGGVRHPDLPADDPVPVAGRRGGGLLIRGVGARRGLGQREGADHRAARQPPQPAIALRVCARVLDQLGHERVGDHERRGHRRARPPDGLDGQRIAEVVASGASPRGRHRHAVQTEARGGADHVRRELAARVDGGRARRHHLAREALGVGLERDLFRREVQKHRFTYIATEAQRSQRKSFVALVLFVPLWLGVAFRDAFEDRPQARRAVRQIFRQHARFGDGAHEVGVAVPPGDEMNVQVLEHAGACGAAQVDPDVDAVRAGRPRSGPSRRGGRAPSTRPALPPTSRPGRRGAGSAPPSRGRCCRDRGSG